ncbi:anthranilate synthase component II [Fusarium mundagurra]|uniref:Anthranilate synthase component II n=1 Tax=Fusarium mundagurra TaxID=1567541 RepID=A0A8H5Z218_9HYPO|nr:anthranilate synthase component II [Fusarium mundagurra]
MVAQIFKNRIIAAAGPLPGQLTVENLKRWVSLRKGVFIDDFDETVTHLLCTKEQFDKKLPKVRAALKLGKGIHIVHCDWFEYSTVKNKKLPEADYSMRSLVAKENAKKREKTRIEKGKRNAEKFVDTNNFHLYRDRLNFVYQVDITRDNEFTGEFGQKYSLCLWESNAKPHLYWFTAKFLKQKGSSQPMYHRPSSHQGKWRVEMELFMDFFKKKTGIAWEDRVSLAQTMPSSYFQYEPPSRGKPIGRRLKHDIEYCRMINASIRGLPWPPPKEEERKTDSAEDESGDGPRALEEEDEVMVSPPDSPRAPAEESGTDPKELGDGIEMASPYDPVKLTDENKSCSSLRASQDCREEIPRSGLEHSQDEKATITNSETIDDEKKAESPPESEKVQEADKSTNVSMDCAETKSALAAPASSIDEKDLSHAVDEDVAVVPGDVGEMRISFEFGTRESL